MTREIKWSGHIWGVKSGIEGPGPNNYSDSKENVYVDDKENLHLKIIYKNDVWHCCELYTTEKFGYGTYIFDVQALQNIADNVVLGMFVYQSDDEEIDIEIGKWGTLDGHNAGFAVQPVGTNKMYDSSNNYRFDLRTDNSFTNRFYWSKNEIYFKSESGTQTVEWKYPSKYIPETYNERVHLNLWLVKGNPPSNNAEQEVVIKEFKFVQNRLLI
jgi:hypothetical protein